MKVIYRTFAILATTAMIASASYAEDAPRPAADAKAPGLDFKGICKDDIKSFCADVKPGEGRTVACLKEHEKKLSTQCHGAVQTIQTAGQNKPPVGAATQTGQAPVVKGDAKAAATATKTATAVATAVATATKAVKGSN